MGYAQSNLPFLVHSVNEAALRDRSHPPGSPRYVKPALPLYGSFSVLYEPVVGEAEVVVAEEAVVG